MAQTARHITDYATGLRAMFEEEYMGEGLFEALAGYHDGVARQAFLLMAKIERAMIAATESAIRRNGLQIRDPESLRAEGRAEAETMRIMSWPDFLDLIVTDYPAFLDEFEQVAQLAPPCDAVEAQLLIDHEVAFIDFAVACRRGDPDSLGVLESFLARIT
ncbi:hypothetical protein [Ruegeria sp. PrR005]|uniref:Uncharacterized protein n=1 Tax=Ruegeria sp. PrR005 TaxID=2706882 RepID=A0A6B2NS44_9RHOB|nr:hypothetical protein [Ruegeria sp. PrR005]NDW45633.1 hypothetical protein [Ruegeria sp. PrR005]